VCVCVYDVWGMIEFWIEPVKWVWWMRMCEWTLNDVKTWIELNVCEMNVMNLWNVLKLGWKWMKLLNVDLMNDMNCEWLECWCELNWKMVWIENEVACVWWCVNCRKEWKWIWWIELMNVMWRMKLTDVDETEMCDECCFLVECNVLKWMMNVMLWMMPRTMWMVKWK